MITSNENSRKSSHLTQAQLDLQAQQRNIPQYVEVVPSFNNTSTQSHIQGENHDQSETSTYIPSPTSSVSSQISHTEEVSTQTQHSPLDNTGIHIISEYIFDSLLDDVRYKNKNDYRVILQNTNGIHEFRDTDPDYYPTMRAINNTGADLISLV